MTASLFLLHLLSPYVHVQLAREVTGVSPAAAARWWGDFREGHDDHRFFPGSRRQITERGPTHVTMVEKVVGVPWESVTAWPGENEVRFVGRNRASRFSGTYRFEPTPTGTRIALEADIHLAKPLRWADAPGKPVVLAMLLADLAGHAKELQRELGA